MCAFVCVNCIGSVPRKQLHPLGQMVLTWLFSMRNLAAISSASPPISPIITIPATDTQTSGTNLSYHHNTYNRHTDIRHQSLLSSQYLQQTHRHQGPISPIITIPTTDTQTSGTNLSYHHNTYNRHTYIRNQSLLSSQYLQQTHRHQGPISPIITIPATDTQTSGTNLSYHHNTYNRHTDIRDQSLLSSQYLQQTHSHQGPISPIRHTDIRDQISPIITIPTTDTQTSGTNLSYHHNTCNRHTDIRHQISPIITIPTTDTQTSGTNLSYHHNIYNRHTDIRDQSLLSSQYLQQTHRHQAPNLSYHHNTCNRHTAIRDQSLLSDTQTSGTKSLLSSQYLQQTHRHQGPISPIITIHATDTETSGTNLSYHHNTYNRHTDIRHQSLLSSQYLQQTHRHQGPISPIITIHATDTETSGTNLSYHHNTCNRHTDIRHQSLLSSQYLQQTHRHQGPISPIITIHATDTQTSGTNLSYHHNTCNRHTDIRDQSLLSS